MNKLVRGMLVFVVGVVAMGVCRVDGFGGSNNNKPPPHYHPLQKQLNNHPQQRPLPRYYAEQHQNPHIIASSRPIIPNNSPHPASYRTLNPGNMMMMNHRSARAEADPNNNRHHPHHQHSPQLLASASNTPVLVLKKDHARPILSSAVVAAAIAEKRQQQVQAEKSAAAVAQANKNVKEIKQQQQIPTVIMERPGGGVPPHPQKPQQQQQQEQKKESHQPEQTSQSKEELEQEDHQASHEAQQPQPPPQITSLEQDIVSASSSSEHEPQLDRVNSAERRMFFNSMNENVQHAQQVSGPQQGPPHHHHQRVHKPQHHASASSIQSTRANRPPPVHHNHNHPEINIEDEEDHPIERIVRSNSNNPYNGGGLAFEYPPPQGNYIAQGPTRVPVKYQQGVIGIKPHQQQQQHHQGGGHPGGNNKQQPRPYRQRIQQQQNQNQQQGGGVGSEEPLSEELEDEEEAKPDRLQELLADSKFTCDGKKDGYYADETLNCEVFHYCQANSKHSWLCPSGFVFHQIHLICVPPSTDNICKQSTNYAKIVNEYLYRPINEKEAEGTNISLKYADRYFPDSYNNGAGDVILPYSNAEYQQEEDDDDQPQQQHRPSPQHHQQSYNPYAASHHQPPRTRPNPITPQVHQPSYNPYASVQPQHRPPSSQQLPSTYSQGGFVPSPQLHHAQQQRHAPQHAQRHHPQPYAQQRSGSSVHPHQVHPLNKQSGLSGKPPQHPHHHHPHPKHHHSSSASPSQSGPPGVFFTPESINIPLQKRRPLPNPHPNHNPQAFRPSPQVHAQKSLKESNRRRDEEEQTNNDDEYEY